MLAVLSPAKTLDYENPLPAHPPTHKPPLLDHSTRLVEELQQYPQEALQKLMDISPKLAVLNQERFEEWHSDASETRGRPALLAFQGDVYQGLDAKSLSREALAYADGHLRILSGLYGILRPMDLMQPYRLEMGTKLSINGHKNLYEYWSATITQRLNEEIEAQPANEERILVNLASNEYFKAVNTDELDELVVDVDFKEMRDGKLKTIALYAKKARGMMARFIVEHQLTRAEDLKAFDLEGYQFAPQYSYDDYMVFVR